MKKTHVTIEQLSKFLMSRPEMKNEGNQLAEVLELIAENVPTLVFVTHREQEIGWHLKQWSWHLRKGADDVGS